MNFLRFLSVSILVVASTAASAQSPEFPQPVEQHEWLQKLEGRWETKAKTNAMGDIPAMDCNSTMSAHMLGKFWVVMNTTGEFGGVQSKILQTIGYDRKQKKYVATWIDNMSDHMYVYHGSVDETGKKLVLETEGPNFLEPGKTAKFRDSYEFKSPDLIITTSELMGDDGKWVTFVTAETRRVAADPGN